MKMFPRLSIYEQKLDVIFSSTCFSVILLFDLNSKNSLRIFSQIESLVETNGPKKRRLHGKTDYTVRLGNDVDIFDNILPRERHLIATEAKNCSLDQDDLWQCVAEAACCSLQIQEGCSQIQV
jgi:hypothetical protein